jgi:hypothetical protein
MPISPFWYLIPWLVIAYLAFRWRRLAGAVFVALSVVGIIVLAIFTGVEKHYDEQMAYELIDFGSGSSFHRVVRFTNSHGDSFWGGSAAFAEHVKQTRPPTVRVSMTATYDFGRFRAYRISWIDGDTP